MHQRVFVVGNKFLGFSEQAEVFTVSQFIKLGTSRLIERGASVVLGQGLCPADVEKVRSVIRALGLHEEERVSHYSRSRAGRHHCHKHRPENALVSLPRKVTDTHYELDLMIDENCADMSDHVTGQHIQGMVLIEAARQTFMTVTEHFFFADDRRGTAYFVINNFDTRFVRFLFPLPVTIEYRLMSHTTCKHGNHKFEATIGFYQGGDDPDCIVDVAFSTYDAARLKTREAEMGRDRLRTVVPVGLDLARGELAKELTSASRQPVGAVQ